MSISRFALFVMTGCTIGLASTSLPADEPSFSFTMTEGPQLPIAVGAHACGSIDGHAVVAGGSHWSDGPNKKKSWRTECFIARDGQWTPGPALPSGLAEMAYGSDDHCLVIAGGNNASVATTDAFILRSVDDNATWEQLAPLPVATNGAGGALMNGTFYVFGGLVDDTSTTAVWSLDVNDPAASWQQRAPLPSVRSYPGAAVIGDSIYVFGGYIAPDGDTPAGVQADAYRYDTANNKWELLQNWNLPGYCWAAAPLDDRHILLAGQATLEEGITPPVRLVNLDTMTWQEVGQLVNPTCAMGMIKVSATQWWVPGGEPDANKNRTARNTIVERIAN